MKVRLQTNSNFHSSLSERKPNEFLCEDFSRWTFTPTLLVFPSSLHFISHQFHADSFQVWHKKKERGKKENPLRCKYLRFIFKLSWNLCEHWGAISHLHWHLISPVESESTNCRGFPVCPIILHQFPWPCGTLVN